MEKYELIFPLHFNIINLRRCVDRLTKLSFTKDCNARKGMDRMHQGNSDLRFCLYLLGFGIDRNLRMNGKFQRVARELAVLDCSMF